MALLGEPMRGEAMTTLLEVSEELFGKRPEMRSGKVRYQEVLAESAFSEVETLSVEVERTWTPDALIGFAYSTSFASAARVGDRREEFERELRVRLEPHYRERVTVDAVLGRQH